MPRGFLTRVAQILLRDKLGLGYYDGQADPTIIPDAPPWDDSYPGEPQPADPPAELRGPFQPQPPPPPAELRGPFKPQPPPPRAKLKNPKKAQTKPSDTRLEVISNGVDSGMYSFRAQLQKYNAARGNRFECVIMIPSCMGNNQDILGNNQKLTLWCEEAVFPGLGINSAPIRINNLNIPRANSIDFQGEQLALQFIVDGEWKIKEYFQKWMMKIVDPTDRLVAFYKVGSNLYYSTQIHLRALDMNDNVIREWIIEEAFPRSMSPTPVGHSNNMVQRLTVSFTYKSWKENVPETERAREDFPDRGPGEGFGGLASFNDLLMNT